MTLQEAQEILHRMYQGDNTFPSTNDEDYVVRTSYLNDAIDQWASEDQWRELFITLSSAGDGDKVTVQGQSEYDAPTDFVAPVSALRIADGSDYVSYYQRVSQESVHLYENDEGSRFYYVTGNPSVGYTIHINPEPSEAGLTISYEYYKTPTRLSNTSDVFEMPDPYFAIYTALANLYENDGQGNRANLALAKATDRLQTMKRNNLAFSFMQDDSIPDRDTALGVGGFGV